MKAFGLLGDAQSRVMDALFVALLDDANIRVAAIEVLGQIGKGQHTCDGHFANSSYRH